MANSKVEKLLKESLLVHKEIKDVYENSAEYRWKNKEVEEIYSLYDGDTLNNVLYKDCLKVEITNELKETGSSALKITNETTVENVNPRPWPSVTINTNTTEIKRFNRVSFNIFIKATGYENFYIHFAVGNDEDVVSHAYSVKPNSWEHVAFELEEPFKEIKFVKINPWIMGTPPEGLKDYIIYLDRVVLEKVTIDQAWGWRDSGIAYSHIGYLPKSEKIAWTSQNNGDSFILHKFNNGKDKKIKLKAIEIKNKYGKFHLLDFSKIDEIDTYYIEYGNLETEEFEIANDIFDESVVKSINFLRLLRCGCTIDGVHTACHLNCRAVHPLNDSTVPVFGGWHDAGDVSQFEIPTAEMAEAILDLAQNYKGIDNQIYERLLEEARVGLDWLLQTRFGDGYRALAVTYNYWRSNVLKKDNLTVYKNCQAEEGTFENFLSSAALAQGYLSLKDYGCDNYSAYLLRAAVEDYNFAKAGYESGKYSKRWGPTIDSVTCGTAILACVKLYLGTNNTKYLSDAVKYADIVMSCQEKEYLGDLKPIRGFFYEDPKHTYVLTYEHRGHEQSPIQGLVELMKVLPSHDKYPEWKQACDLYLEYVTKSMEYASCYNLLPGHVYIMGKINYDRFTIPSTGYGTKEEGIENLDCQAKSGLKLGDGIYLRMFPIAVQRRGYHATLLSKTKAVSSIYSLTKDEKTKQIVLHQLEWIFGCNPFNSSTMYGLGHNYHPLYVAFSRQMVGSLPVGIMTRGYDDAPYWPVRDGAVYKEIWGHTTGKYLWILADIMNNISE